jgi:small-conductance mechanosensitive channel
MDLRELIPTLANSDDIPRAIGTIRKLLSGDTRELADSSVNLVVRPWCRAPDYWAVRLDLNQGLKRELEAAGCSIPFPQRDVHLPRAERVA